MKRRRFVASTIAGSLGVAGLGSAAGASQGDVEFTPEGDALTLAPAPGQSVTGTTSYAEGVELTIRLQSSGSSPFLRSQGVTVAEDGTFEATFDLSKVDPGTEFTATARWYGMEQVRTTGEVVALDPNVSLDVDGEALTLDPDAEQRITGTSDLSKGETVTLRLRSQRGEVFIKQAEPTVGADGSFTATVDMSGLADGTLFLVEAYYDGSRQAFAIGELSG